MDGKRKKKKKRKSRMQAEEGLACGGEGYLPPFSVTLLSHIRTPEFHHSPLSRTSATRVGEYLRRTSNLSGRLKQYCLLC